MREQRTYYVYILARPSGKPFYVGKGSGERIFAHELEARRGCKCRKCAIIRDIWRRGGEVHRYKVFTSTDNREALAYETETIRAVGLHRLVNLVDSPKMVTPGKIVGARKRVATMAQIRAVSEHLSTTGRLRWTLAAHLDRMQKTAEQAAQATGIPLAYIQGIRDDTAIYVHLDRVTRLCRWLRVRPGDLLIYDKGVPEEK